MVEAQLSVRPDIAAHVREADNPRSPVARFGRDKPLRLDAGVELSPFQIAYQTYGTLNAQRSNAILVCHALTGDQHVNNVHPVTGKPGWWDSIIGPGKPIDTERYFVICPNVVGACMGTTGPASTNPATGKPWGLDFPVITIRDMVRAQAMLLDHLGIEQLFSVAGGSMGGMQVLQWAASYPERVYSALPIATAHAPFGAEHRVPRGRPPGRDGRPGMAAGALSGRGREPAARARGRPHGRAHHLSLGCRAAPQVRTQVPGSRRIRRSRSTPISRSNPICAIRASRSSSASTPIRISISPARWTISTSRRTMTACSPTRSRARRRGSA